MTAGTFSPGWVACSGVMFLHNRYEEIFFFFYYEDLDLEMSGSVFLDYLFLQQKSVSALLYLDVTL